MSKVKDAMFDEANRVAREVIQEFRGGILAWLDGPDKLPTQCLPVREIQGIIAQKVLDAFTRLMIRGLKS